MRSIKFRFRNKETKKIIDEPMFIDNDGIVWRWVDNTETEVEVIDTEMIIVEQYIGKKDTSGKEIYEGDIFKYENNNQEQKIEGIGLIEDIRHIYMGYNATYIENNNFNIKVIGNMYEIPIPIKD